MNYVKHYEDLIQQARLLVEDRNDDCYYETHHIVPKSMGGVDDTDNLVKLTAKEHFVAHHLLWRIHKITDYRFKMAKAFLSMTKNGKGQERYYSARGYEEARKVHSGVMKEWIKDNHPRGMKGKEHNEETKQKISEGVKQSFKEKGLLVPVYKFSKEGELMQEFDSINDAAKNVNGVPSNIKYTCEGRFKTAYGFRWSYDKNKCDDRSLERKKHYHTDDKKKSMSKQFSGTVVAIDTTGNKFRVSLDDDRLITGEIKRYVSPNMTHKLTQKHKCQYCGKETNIGNLKRWHGEKCKHKQ